VTVGRPRLYAVLLDLFAAVGLTLAIVGVFGVTTSSVVQRTREIGVRMALGARRREVLSMIMRSAMLMVVAGLIAGLGAAALLTRFLETMLFDVQPLDGWVFALAAAGFAIVSALAALLPARRATRVDPLVALRAE
jgi:ABC-type antimicrobial peptide transport system permease subunit